MRHAMLGMATGPTIGPPPPNASPASWRGFFRAYDVSTATVRIPFRGGGFSPI